MHTVQPSQQATLAFVQGSLASDCSLTVAKPSLAAGSDINCMQAAQCIADEDHVSWCHVCSHASLKMHSPIKAYRYTKTQMKVQE